MRLSWRLLPFFIFIVLSLFLYRGLSLDPHVLPSVEVGKILPDFNLKTLAGDSTFTPLMLRGQISLLNVWASWCPACTEEQTFLLSLKKQGIALYGLNYKDTEAHAKAWLEEWGDPYLVVGQDVDGKVALDLGVYGAPETFLIDSTGKIIYRQVGVVNEVVWNQEFLPRIKALEGIS